MLKGEHVNGVKPFYLSSHNIHFHGTLKNLPLGE